MQPKRLLLAVQTAPRELPQRQQFSTLPGAHDITESDESKGHKKIVTTNPNDGGYGMPRFCAFAQ